MKNKFELFKKYCREYIDKYELNNWTFVFHNGLTSELKKEFENAAIHRNILNCQADIYYDGTPNKTIEDIKKAAQHEIIHCLTGKVYVLGILRCVQREDIDREEEELVHKLEKLLKL